MHALRTLLAGTLDYAGLFPPAKLEMAPTVANYGAYRHGPDAWFLGRLVVPVSRFEEFERCAERCPPDRLSIVSGPTHDDVWTITALTAAAEDPALAADLEAIERFNERHARHGAQAVLVDTIELKARSAAAIDAALDLLPDELFPYFEFPIDQDPRGMIASLAGLDAGAKVRTGGLTADAHPDCEQLARFLVACARAEVPFKATAGLHHPHRHLAQEPACKQHGFLNLFVGGCLAFAGRAGDEELARLLADESPAAFRITGDGIGWRDLRLTVGEIRNARDAFAHAFGSCSFDEPLADLRALGILTRESQPS